MWLFLIVSVLIDQVSKIFASNISSSIILIPNFLSLEYVENRGAVFGIMQGSNTILAILSFIICIVISIYIYIQKKSNNKIPFAWYMILAGGIGNLIDRIIRGYVVDFIATPFIATFNIADSFVVLGVIWLLLIEIKDWYQNRKNERKG